MKRWFVGSVLAAITAGIGMYLINPYGTASLDPRARLTGYTTFRVASASMAPTLQKNDLILVHAGAYMSGPPAAGDLIVFRYPRDRSVVYVSRVAGGPGDTVAIDKGTVFVNGSAVAEPYLADRRPNEAYSLSMKAIPVPEGHLFVLGDNRDNSRDSRFWGFLLVADTIGRVTYIWMSDDPGRVGKVQ